MFAISHLQCSEQPSVGEGHENPIFKHSAFIDETCTKCHLEDRPGPLEALTHGGGKDCTECHIAKDDHSGWLPRKSFSHKPDPESCLDCHVQDRPKRETHIQTGDCVNCHKYPSFKP